MNLLLLSSPTRRICELVPAESAPQPAFQIMRRSAHDRRPKPHSQSGSVAGEDVDLSDVEPSEAGSAGGRSNATGGSGKKWMTIEEREAAYNEARSRIFMDFEEKEKEKDASANSSTLSLFGSGENSFDGDVDDAASTPATESEWALPYSRDRKDTRRGMPVGNPGPSSSRTLWSNMPNGSGGSSRNSRSSSPAFQYATLYEPPPQLVPYDMLQPPGQLPGPNYLPYWPYQVPPGAQGQPVQPNYAPPYPYYPTWYWPPPQQNPNLPPSDPSGPPGGEMYLPPHPVPPQAVPYPNPYAWPNAPQPALQHGQHPGGPHPIEAPPAPAPPPNPHFPTFAPPYSYPPAFYPGQPRLPANQPLPPPPHPVGQPFYGGEPPPPLNSNAPNVGRNGHVQGVNEPRVPSRNPSIPSLSTNGPKRNAPPTRSAWSYGPGIGIPHQTGAFQTGDTVGPRLSTVRRPSATLGLGGGVGNKASANDEASSTAVGSFHLDFCQNRSADFGDSLVTLQSSSPSSSSRRTFPSMPTSQHPLPARPDWAVGMKPSQGPSKHVRNNNARAAQNHGQPISVPSPIALQAVDFPPLSGVPEKRIPVIAGVWNNGSSARATLTASPVQAGAVPDPTLDLARGHSHLEEFETGFERPQPRGAVELFNPKVNQRMSNGNSSPRPDRLEKEKDRPRADGGAAGPLANKLASMSLEEERQRQDNGVQMIPSTSSADTA
jgi:hypothetical protein